jgi:vancomycin permeability regulator SanA
MKKAIKYTICVLMVWFLLHTALIVSDGLLDETGKSDVGIILGNKVNPDGTVSVRLAKRLDKGIELYQDSSINLIVVSGGLGKEGFYEGTSMSEYLQKNGIPKSKIIVDNAGITTPATAKNFRKMNLEINSITVISQYHHITRTKLAFKKEGYDNVKGAHAAYFEGRDFYSIFREFFGYYKYLID